MTTIYEQFPNLDKDLAADNRVWREIDEESYDIMLEILPPKRMRGNGFVVSEAKCHLDNDQAVYLVCYSMRDKYFATALRECSLSAYFLGFTGYLCL